MKPEYEQLARTLLEIMQRYDRENHTYYAYYFLQAQETAVQVLSVMLEQLLPRTEPLVGVAENPDFVGGKFGG